LRSNDSVDYWGRKAPFYFEKTSEHRAVSASGMARSFQSDPAQRRNGPSTDKQHGGRYDGVSAVIPKGAEHEGRAGDEGLVIFAKFAPALL
jgi:hypothetical protein